MRTSFKATLAMIALGLALAGCTGRTELTTFPTTAPPTSANPAPSVPAPTPGLPEEAGAIDANQWDVSSFVSPNGTTVCAMSAEGVTCDLPSDFTGKTPKESDVCPEGNLFVSGVDLGDKARYICAGDIAGEPRVGGDEAQWWAGTGFDSVTVGDEKWAALPNGQKLKAGHFVCASQANEITCANTKAGTGMRIAKAAVTLLN